MRLYNLHGPEHIIIKRILQRMVEMKVGTLFIDECAIKEFKNYYEPIDLHREESILI